MKIAIIALVMICSQSMFSQTKTVSGSVKDATGELLPGVSVVVRGTQKGVQTDFDGLFKIENISSTDELIFSYIGMTAKTVLVGDRARLDVILMASLESLDEIVVVAYGKQSRKTVTGAIATVDADEIASLPVTNAEQALQGRAAGVTIVNSGSPGSSPQVLIRGLGTFGNNSPLYVIDGVIVGNLSGISPSDIENVSILKDASTTALYGARGSNGVVLVTTKTGKLGKGKLNFSAYTGAQMVTNRYNLMNTTQYLQFAANNNVFPDRPLELFQNNTNWQDEIFRVGLIQDYKLDYSKGTENSTQFFSAEYLKQEGTIINTGFDRYSFRANSSYTSGKFKFGQTMSVAISKSRGEQSGGGRTLITHAIKSVPFLPVYNPNNPGGFQGPSNAGDEQDAENPVRIQTLPTFSTNNLGIIGSLYGEYNILESLKFRTQIGLDYFNSRNSTFIPSFSDDPSNTHSQNFASYGAGANWGQALVLTNSLNYVKTFAEKHNVEFLALAEKTENTGLGFGGSARNLVTDELQQFGSDSQTIGSGNSKTTRLGYLARLNYNFDSKYIFSASIRRDASSRFGSNNRWGTFPSASLGWVLSEEDFFGDDSSINNLKLRGSYGITGNDAIGDYRYAATLVGDFQYPLGDTNGAGFTENGGSNPDLKWEEISMLNIGLDVGFFNNKFTASLEYYKNTSDDLLVNLPTALSSGSHAGNITANVGSVETKGFEAMLGYNDNEGDFTWSANFNIGSSSNKVLFLGVDEIPGYALQDAGVSVTNIQEGEAINHFYGYVSDGIYQNQAEVDAVFSGDLGQTAVQAGDIRYKDISGDGKIDADDRTVLGDGLADFTYGLNLSANYKNFDASLFITGVQGADVYNTIRFDLEGGSRRVFNGTTELLNSWTPSNTSTTMPRFGGSTENFAVSDRFIEDGSYTRLKNISLGFTLPDNALNGYLSKVRVYASAQNLLTITDYNGLDPELTAGVDLGRYPQPKSFLFGVQVSF
ncbi:TonB-dependent receptor [Polaribacter sp. PL03]|uniref:SusC/RagA family TonB-linked outer membrane protein n=1 Tax=Polaribacter sp. PL03 TaxID=3088353 RepID=UPI0029CAE8BC|nr:TonB-dependent receptor [Polaribacter sp. PL03]MDX6746611.1 TonB-dependent receptor [Polaribacter sp. PL03]